MGSFKKLVLELIGHCADSNVIVVKCKHSFELKKINTCTIFSKKSTFLLGVKTKFVKKSTSIFVVEKKAQTIRSPREIRLKITSLGISKFLIIFFKNIFQGS